MEHWRHLVENLPFIGLMAADQRNRPYITRLLEQATPGVLVGLMVAALGVWRSDSLQDKDIALLSVNDQKTNLRIDKVEKNAELMRSEMREEIKTGFKELSDKMEYRLSYKPLPNYKGKQ